MIEKYGFGKIVIDGKTYNHDVIIFGDTVIPNWWRKKGHELCVTDLESAIERFQPKIIVVGTGKFGLMRVLPEMMSYLQSLQIQLIVEKTQQACEIYNQFSKKEKPLGAFHLTC